jgi:microcystin-dependent protein
MPTHVHQVNASTSTTGGSATANGNYLGGANNAYRSPSAGGTLTSLLPATVTSTGGSQAHLSMQPFLILSFCIALQGIFPSPN